MTDTDKRNACVTCGHCKEGVDLPACRHPLHVTKWWDRVRGEEQIMYPDCYKIRSRQRTDACPHWEAK